LVFLVAIKATGASVNGEFRAIFKQPKTDDGTKNSLKGYIKVILENGSYKAIDEVSAKEEQTGELLTVFKDGKLLIDYSLEEIRERINSTL
jgi:nicotinamide phosphoribosyltransferase